MRNLIVSFIAILSASVYVTLYSSYAVAGGTQTSPYGMVYPPSECTPVYGGGVVCPKEGQVLIDKQVKNPATDIFVDNLGPNDPKYRTQQVITFKIIVKNSGDKSISKVTVKDTIPSYVDFMTGPGNFDKDSRVLTFIVNDLVGGTSQEIELKGRTVHPAVLPKDKNVVCQKNNVDALSDIQIDHDDSQFCIEKKMEIPVQPEAGPGMWLISITGLVSSLGVGLKLRRKTV